MNSSPRIREATVPYRFYGAEISYFSAKVRPALRYKGIHYVELLPDYQNVIIPRTGLAFIPIVVTPDDETLQDTSEILDEIENRFPDTLWMVQRPLDAYRRLDSVERATVDRILAGTGCEALLAYAPRHRLNKCRFKLVFS